MSRCEYQCVTSWDNLVLAYRKASRGKRGKEPAARFEYHLEDNLIGLQSELCEKTCRPGPYHSFPIHHPKRRPISAAPFRDRVVPGGACPSFPVWRLGRGCFLVGQLASSWSSMVTAFGSRNVRKEEATFRGFRVVSRFS